MSFRYVTIAFLLTLLSFSGLAKTNGKFAEMLNKGKALYNDEQYSEATDLYLDAMSYAKRSNDRAAYAEGLYELGKVYVRMDDVERAMYYFQQSYDRAKDIGDRVLQGKCASYMASCSGFCYDLKQARHYYALQKTLPNENDNMKQYYLLFNGALISYLEGHIKEARKQTHLAIDCANRFRLDGKYIQSCYGLLVYMQLDEGNTEKALQYCEEFRHMAQDGKRLLWREAYYEMLSDVYQAANDSSRAKTYRRLADSTFNARIAGQHIKAIDNKVVKFEDRHNREDINKLSVTVSRQWLFIVACLVFVAVLVALVAVIVRKNRRLKHAYQLVIARNHDLAIADRMSKKLRQKSIAANDTPATDSEKATAGGVKATASDAKPTAGGDEAKGPDDTTTSSGSAATDVNLSQEQIDDILQRVTGVMENVDIISKPDFTLVMLSRLIGSNTRYVSWVINNTFHKNFKTLLNEYRIREVCRRMEDTDNFGNLTIQALSNSLGYSSASNFLRAFKNVNGMTPSTYQKLIMERKNGASDKSADAPYDQDFYN